MMKTLKNHILIYDKDCPMCAVYSSAFIGSGMLDKNGREAFCEISLEDKNLLDYNLDVATINESDAMPNDFIVGTVWGELPEPGEEPQVLVDRSSFNCDLTEEEINILAILMMCGWTQRQVTSIENTRMKYSGSDFKFTSQANHLSKLLVLKQDYERQGFHLQRLYKRRKRNSKGIYISTFSEIMNTDNSSSE